MTQLSLTDAEIELILLALARCEWEQPKQVREVAKLEQKLEKLLEEGS
jgi:hypothetical protein